jgi:hypothetical protein
MMDEAEDDKAVWCLEYFNAHANKWLMIGCANLPAHYVYSGYTWGVGTLREACQLHQACQTLENERQVLGNRFCSTNFRIRHIPTGNIIPVDLL